MSVNNMTFEQAATFITALTKQVTGETVLTPVTSADFVSVATKTLAAGVDPVLSTLTQMISRTIFSMRAYNRHLADVITDTQRFGAITRKIKVVDQDFSNNAEFTLTDGVSVDPWTVKLANVLQLNFYGANVFDLDAYSVFRDQLNNAFRGPGEFAEFVGMLTQNDANIVEQKIETVSRMLVANFIAGKLTANNGIIHLLTEYNAETGLSLTSTSVYAPANFPDFVYWLYARLETLASMMSERSQLYQINITGKEINQFTNPENLRVKMYAPLMNAINARVRAKTFDNSYLQMAATEAINFWQSIGTPNTINMTPAYLDATTGAVVTAGSAVNNSTVVGVMYDRDALGINIINEWAAATPINPKGGYSNRFYHFTERYYTDFTEKGIVLCMD